MKEHYSTAWWLVTALFSVLMGELLSLMLFTHALFWAVMSVLVCGLLWHVSEQYQASLVACINSASALQVDMSLPEGRGCLPDARLAVMQQRILLDPRTGLTQMLNLAQAGAEILRTALYVMPCALFWLIVELVMFQPELVAVILNNISNITTSQEMIVALQATGAWNETLARWLFAIWSLWTIFRLVAGWNPGFRNCWREGLNRKLQSYFDYPSSSPFRFSRMDDTPATEIQSHGR